MPIHVDFTVSAELLTWVGPSGMTEIIPKKRYQTPDAFYVNTLIVMVRGLPVAAENDDGYNILDERTFEMKTTLNRPSDWIMVGYVKKEA